MVDGRVLYYDSCGFCRSWARFWPGALRKRGLDSAPLQGKWVRAGPNAPPEELLLDLRLLLADGMQVGGAHVYRHAMLGIGLTYPLSVAPIPRRIFDRRYRSFANNPYRLSRACRLATASVGGPGPAPAHARSEAEQPTRSDGPRGE